MTRPVYSHVVRTWQAISQHLTDLDKGLIDKAAAQEGIFHALEDAFAEVEHSVIRRYKN